MFIYYYDYQKYRIFASLTFTMRSKNLFLRLVVFGGLVMPGPTNRMHIYHYKKINIIYKIYMYILYVKKCKFFGYSNTKKFNSKSHFF